MILGTVELGLNYGVNNDEGKPSHQQAFEILDTAWEGGIRELDTAAAYGDSEAVIGAYQDKTKRSFLIDTKLPISIDDSLKTSFRLSCKKLNTDHLNLLYIHSFEQCKDRRIIEFLRRLKADGKISHIGVSIYEPLEMEYIINYLPEVDTIQFPYNLLDNDRWEKDDLLKQSVAAGKCLYARSVFLQGLFFKNNLDLFVSRLGASNYISTLTNLAEKNEMTIAEMAYKFVLENSEINAAILGCQNNEEVIKNLKLEKSEKTLNRKIRSELKKLSKDISTEVIDPRKWKK